MGEIFREFLKRIFIKMGCHTMQGMQEGGYSL